jgi:hypothetical protein
MTLATSTQADDPGRARLFEIATPDLYQVNAFRVLGLPVHTSREDVRKREKRMRRNERLSLSAPLNGGYLPLPTIPDEDDARQAMYRLQDPLARLFDEFFWFWPNHPGRNDDKALTLLGRKRTQDAHKLWLTLESSGTHDMVSTHNLAVLYHVSALDFERRLAKQPLLEQDNKTRLGCWRRAYKRWHILVNHDPFWARVRDRIHELDDPQLTQHLAHEIRDALSEVILLINARLAVKASEANMRDLASQQVQIMRQSQFEQTLINNSLRECLRPIRHRISTLCNDAEPKADADPISANVVTRSLLKDACPLLNTIDMMLSEGDPMREGAHDEVARTALRCQITYANETDNWKESSAILDVILTYLRPSDSMRTRITDSRDIVATNLRLGTCYFCKERRSSDDCEIKVPMHGDVRKIQSGWNTYRVTWQHTEIGVPRCRECNTHHDRINSSYSGGALAGLLAGALGFLSIFAIGPGGFWVGIVLAAIGALIGGSLAKDLAQSQTPYKMKGDTDVRGFERVKELRKQGWKDGKEPSQDEQNNARHI